MVEYVFAHHVEPSGADTLEEWVGSPPRGPATGAWANTPLADRREVTWAMATILGDYIAIHSNSEPDQPFMSYLTVRMAAEHPASWIRFASTHHRNRLASLQRRLYRLENAVRDVVVSTIMTCADNGAKS